MVRNYGETIPEFVKNYRKFSGYTQSQMGKILGYSGQQVSNIERGAHPRPLAFCLKLLKKLDTPRANWLHELVVESVLDKVDRKSK